MEGQFSHLTQKVWKSHLSNPNHRLIIGISGVPGSGKTTLAKLLVSNLNSLQLQNDPKGGQEIAILVPMDGFHLTRKQLDAFPDPVEAHARRGARWTFDADGFVEVVRRVRSQSLSSDETADEVVKVPSFSHALKDPVADDICVMKHHKIVVFEGLYLVLNTSPWDIPIQRGWYDELWFATVDRMTARERLAKRHLAAGIVQTLEDGRKRAVESDELNGDEILEFLDKQNVNEMIESKEDERWITTDGG